MNQRNNRTQQPQLLRIPTGRRQTSWLFTSTAEKLNQGLPGSNSTSVRAGLEPGISGSQRKRPNHWATLPPAYTGLHVVRATENQKALNCVVLKYSIPVSEE